MSPSVHDSQAMKLSLGSKLVNGGAVVRDAQAPHEEPETLVTVQLPDGSSHQHNVPAGQSVLYLKALIHQHHSLPIAQQRLFLGGNEMLDPLSLCDHSGFTEGATITTQASQFNAFCPSLWSFLLMGEDEDPATSAPVQYFEGSRVPWATSLLPSTRQVHLQPVEIKVKAGDETPSQVISHFLISARKFAADPRNAEEVLHWVPVVSKPVFERALGNRLYMRHILREASTISALSSVATSSSSSGIILELCKAVLCSRTASISPRGGGTSIVESFLPYFAHEVKRQQVHGNGNRVLGAFIMDLLPCLLHQVVTVASDDEDAIVPDHIRASVNAMLLSIWKLLSIEAFLVELWQIGTVPTRICAHVLRSLKIAGMLVRRVISGRPELAQHESHASIMRITAGQWCKLLAFRSSSSASNGATSPRYTPTPMSLLLAGHKASGRPTSALAPGANIDKDNQHVRPHSADDVASPRNRHYHQPMSRMTGVSPRPGSGAVTARPISPRWIARRPGSRTAR
eukprot:jgi/Chlat1/8782/Chrsp90S08114